MSELVKVEQSDVRLVAYIGDVEKAIEAVRTLHSKVLRKEIDYGVIPYTGDKPCLLKPGAESLLMAFQLGAGEPIVKRTEITHDGLPFGHCEIEVTIPIIHRGSGVIVGSGVGSCSTMEKKYRYRQAERVCPHCGKSAIIKGREEYGGGWLCYKKKDGCGAKFADNDKAITSQEAGQVENPDPADLRNTVLKMAKKRALVDGALSTCAASGVFTQDVEEMAEYTDPIRPVAVKPSEVITDAEIVDTPPPVDNTPQWFEVWPIEQHADYKVSKVLPDPRAADSYWYTLTHNGVTAECLYVPSTPDSKQAAKENLVTDKVHGRVVTGNKYPRITHVKFKADTADCPPVKDQLFEAELSGPLSPGD